MVNLPTWSCFGYRVVSLADMDLSSVDGRRTCGKTSLYEICIADLLALRFFIFHERRSSSRVCMEMPLNLEQVRPRPV
jgi:hypothetical protein